MKPDKVPEATVNRPPEVNAPGRAARPEVGSVKVPEVVESDVCTPTTSGPPERHRPPATYRFVYVSESSMSQTPPTIEIGLEPPDAGLGPTPESTGSPTTLGTNWTVLKASTRSEADILRPLVG